MGWNHQLENVWYTFSGILSVRMFSQIYSSSLNASVFNRLSKRPCGSLLLVFNWIHPYHTISQQLFRTPGFGSNFDKWTYFFVHYPLHHYLSWNVLENPDAPWKKLTSIPTIAIFKRRCIFRTIIFGKFTFPGCDQWWIHQFFYKHFCINFSSCPAKGRTFIQVGRPGPITKGAHLMGMIMDDGDGSDVFYCCGI